MGHCRRHARKLLGKASVEDLLAGLMSAGIFAVQLTDSLSQLQIQALIRVNDPSQAVGHSFVQRLDLIRL